MYDIIKVSISYDTDLRKVYETSVLAKYLTRSSEILLKIEGAKSR